MAKKRMFSVQIVGSDAFQEMSIGARLLYYELGMVADDDGFVNNAKTIAKSRGIGIKCYQELLDKHFIIEFSSNVIVIKHWFINNYVRRDRHSVTVYDDEYSQLKIKENGAYTLVKNGC